MKIDNIKKDRFSYKENPYLKFTSNNYVVAVKDEDLPEKHISPIFYYDNGDIRSIDDYDMAKIVVIPHKTIVDKPLSRFSLQQIIKISFGTISENERYYEGSSLPKSKIIDSYLYPVSENQIIEFFEGNIDIANSLFTPKIEFFQLIKDVYVESTNCFFVIFENKIIGPFTALKVNDNSFKVSKSSFKNFGEYNYDDNTFLEFEANDINRKIYLESNILKLTFKNEFDFTSDDELVEKFTLELKNYPSYFNEENLENVLTTLKKASEIEKISIKISHNIRLKNILANGRNILLKDMDLLNSIPELKKLKENKQQIEEESFILDKRVRGLEEKKEKLIVEINELEENKTAELEAIKYNLDKEIEDLEIQKINLEKDVEQKRLFLEANLSKTREDIDYYERNKTELKTQIENLREDFKEEQKNAQISLQNLIKSKVHFDFISGRDLSEQEKETLTVHDYKVENQFDPNQYHEFRNELGNILRQSNRRFETHFIDNLLISIFQNTLTVFAGVPGTGKTTLARLLTNILTPKEKIREVSVNRGWTSQKDFIGFVNPLTKRFHSSSTDIYSLMKQMNEESKDEETYLNTPISFIILDEANLSPLEHYWSSFYNLTDSTGMLEVKLGHNETIKFPNNLRFIGTINYDHTTEELSPRVLDRINIIQLNKSDDFSVGNISDSKIKNIQLSYQRCIDFFELTDTIDLKIDDKTETVYKNIKSEFKKLKIYVSPRVEIAIKRYINLASKYMSDVNKPLDYCIAQRLLPLINLQGYENKQKLESLIDQLKNNKCEISVRILEEIIIIGSEKGIYENSFNYFLTLSNV